MKMYKFFTMLRIKHQIANRTKKLPIPTYLCFSNWTCYTLWHPHYTCMFSLCYFAGWHKFLFAC